jgi:hypothetical protein
MKKMVLALMVLWLGGCGTTSVDHVVKTKSELKYKKLLAMPFTKGEGVNASLAQETFLSELALLPDIQIIGKGQMDETTIRNLGVSQPDTYTASDFSTSPEADARRKKVLEKFKADGILFGHLRTDQGLVSLNIQMVDGETGEVILNFSKDASIPEGLVDEATKDIARKAAQKTIDFLKDNVIITKFHRR